MNDFYIPNIDSHDEYFKQPSILLHNSMNLKDFRKSVSPLNIFNVELAYYQYKNILDVIPNCDYFDLLVNYDQKLVLVGLTFYKEDYVETMNELMPVLKSQVNEFLH